MSDFAELLIGLALILSSVGTLMALRPRGGKVISLDHKAVCRSFAGGSGHGRFWSGRPSGVRLFHIIEHLKLLG